MINSANGIQREIYTTALRKAKTAFYFGLSGCSRVKVKGQRLGTVISKLQVPKSSCFR